MGQSEWIELSEHTDLDFETRHVAKIGRNGDGITWVNRSSQLSSLPSNQYVYGVEWVNDMFVAMGESSLITASPDGLTWTTRRQTSSGVTRVAAYGDGMVIVGGNDRVTYRADCR